MREIEEPRFKDMTNPHLQARIDSLHRQIANEERRSSESRRHIALLQDYEEAVNTKYIRNMQATSQVCIETIEKLEDEVQDYKAKWEEQVVINKKLHAALLKVRTATNDEVLKAIL